jgi:hypothetical protein
LFARHVPRQRERRSQRLALEHVVCRAQLGRRKRRLIGLRGEGPPRLLALFQLRDEVGLLRLQRGDACLRRSEIGLGLLDFWIVTRSQNDEDERTAESTHVTPCGCKL